MPERTEITPETARRRRRKPAGPLEALAWLMVGAMVHATVIPAAVYLSALIPRYKPKPKPREVEVVWIDKPSSRVTLPQIKPQAPPQLASVPTPPPRVPPPPRPALAQPQPEDNVKPPPLPKVPKPPALKPPPPQVAKQEPPKPKPPALKPPPPKPDPPKVAIEKPKQPEEQQQQPPPPKVAVPKERKKAVEVDDDKNLVNEPPPEAEYWSDKNRRVAEQTRDTRTNLDRFSKGEASASEKSEDRQSEEVGGEKDNVRQLEKTEATSIEAKRKEESAHSGKSELATGVLVGEKGQAGRMGEGGQAGEGGKPGPLSMRNAQGLGNPGSGPKPNVSPSGANDDAPTVSMSTEPGAGGPVGRAGREGAAGKAGRRGPKLTIDQQDYKRIVGQDAIKEEVELARRTHSHKKGRWEKKLERIHSSLENFTPEVKPGNQTALGTRAAPFALYIARMHRSIHELWGFGFLEDLDGKPASSAMNKRDLKVTLEIVLAADGNVEKATIVRPSGVLTFDVAAIDTVMSAGPYGDTPGEIRSPNGQVYLHWTFHRDERQCSPYFADPFILDKAPEAGQKRGLPDPSDEVARRKRGGPEAISRDGSPTKSNVTVPRVSRTEEPDPAAAARATANLAAPDDPEAQKVAISWLDAFERGDAAGLVAVSATPFRSGDGVGAADAGALGNLWSTVLAESPSRKVREWKLLSAAGYRAVFGRLPKGAEDGTQRLYMAVRVGKDWITLDVAPQGDGSYRVVGFTR